MNILAIGAHYDDLPFGLPGTLLRAVRAGHLVTVVSVIGDYRNWAPVGPQRQDEVVAGIRTSFEARGVDLRFLDCASMAIEADDATRRALAEIVRETAPEIGFLLWPQDSHPDHEVVSGLSKTVYRGAGTILGDNARIPRRLYYYDNGPRHTVGFEPDTCIDISEIWQEAVDWLGELMALIRGPDAATGPAVAAKTALARYRGQTCGVAYAEALKSFQAYPVDIFGSGAG